MKIGQLRHRITLQRRQVVDDGYGGLAEAWVDVATVWAAVEPLRGEERFTAQQVQAGLTHRVTIRYRSDVVPGMRLLYGQRVLEIKQPPIDPDERHRWLELLCEEKVKSGG